MSSEPEPASEPEPEPVSTDSRSRWIRGPTTPALSEPEPASTDSRSNWVPGPIRGQEPEQLIDVVDAHEVVTHHAGDCIFIVTCKYDEVTIRVLEIVEGGVQAIDGMPGSFEKYFTTIKKHNRFWNDNKQFFHDDFSKFRQFFTDTLVNHCGSGEFFIIEQDDTKISIKVSNNVGLFGFETNIDIRYNDNYMSIVSELKETKKTIENNKKMIDDIKIEKEQSDLEFTRQIQELRERLNEYEGTSEDDDEDEDD